VGLLCGLLPLFVGVSRGQKTLAFCGLAICAFAGLLFGFFLAAPAAIIFTGIILTIPRADSGAEVVSAPLVHDSAAAEPVIIIKPVPSWRGYLICLAAIACLLAGLGLFQLSNGRLAAMWSARMVVSFVAMNVLLMTAGVGEMGRSKGYPQLSGLLLGLFFNVLGIVVVALLPVQPKCRVSAIPALPLSLLAIVVLLVVACGGEVAVQLFAPPHWRLRPGMDWHQVGAVMQISPSSTTWLWYDKGVLRKRVNQGATSLFTGKPAPRPAFTGTRVRSVYNYRDTRVTVYYRDENPVQADYRDAKLVQVDGPVPQEWQDEP